ncbi:MAG TPA: hypothetical protein VMU85_13315 [Stellaceae bacterium]|nr:hypothetical protein [Stellaceae bacterium]
MATVGYTIEGKDAECPHCQHKRFTGPATVSDGDRVVCAKCRQVAIVDHAAEKGLRAVGAKRFQLREPNIRRREGTSD